MSSDEEQEVVLPMKRKRGRPSKTDKESPQKGKTFSEDDMDGIHYACDICDQVFLHKSNYLRHSQRHEPPGGFVCSLCQHPSTTEWDRNKHKRDEHSVFRCRICRAEFPMEADYNDHIQQEHEGRDCEYDTCPTCEQQFKSASQLKVHIESKCGTLKKYKCSECNSLYLSQESLNTHMIKHGEKKSHLCDNCGASFANKDKLKVHEKLHTEEKPYKCNKCDKAFVRRDNLITHSTTHSGMKPYNCSYCESRFTCIGNLLKHRRARPDTCGLPQHCLTKAIVPRSAIKTTSNLTDRPVRSNKVVKQVQQAEPPKARKAKVVDVKPVVTKKPLVRKPVKSKKPVEEDVDSDSSEEPPEEKKPNISTIMVDANEHKKSESPQKMVKWKVISSGDDHYELFKDSGHTDSNFEKQTDIIDVREIKIDADGSLIDPENGIYKDDLSQDTWYETVIEAEVIVNLPEKTQLEPSKPEYDAKGIRRTFSEKPPVITTKKKFGRFRRVQEPKPKSENIIVLDLEAQQRELDAQRSIFELNVHNFTEGCYRCAHCAVQHNSQYMIGRHLERLHGIELKELLKSLRWDREFARERKYLCRFCKRLYVNEKALEKHVLLHGPDGKLIHKCTCCPRHFETEDEVQQHAIDDHGEKLQCRFCGKVFPKHCKLVRHVKHNHEGQSYPKRHYVCLKCGKSFSARGQVSDHERSECGQKPIYQCEICHKFLHTASTLKLHYTLHTDNLPFSCQYCGKAYRSRGQVKVHERQHTGEKPFHCEFCPKSFGHRESLHTHRSMHTGIKRYMCSGCGQRFACVSNLQCHRRSHKDTCGMVEKVSRPTGPDGYHELPEGYVLPFPKYKIVD